MKIIFFGLGSIGKRYARMLSDSCGARLYALRTHKSDSPEEHLPVKEVYTWKEVKNIKPDIAFITNPTYLHVGTAIKCANMGMDLFIEKPLASTLKRLGELLKIVSGNKLTTYVAYVLRFHPVVEHIKKRLERQRPLHMHVVSSSYLPAWRPDRDHLKGYSAQRRLGGGVIFDLSHELDYVYYLLGGIKKIKGSFSRRGDVTIDAEDYADILVDGIKGPANVHINFFSHINRRVVKVDFKDSSLEGDLINNTLCEYRNGRLIDNKRFGNKPEDIYKKQTDYFFSNIGNKRMMNNIFEASELFKSIYEFKKNAKA